MASITFVLILPFTYDASFFNPSTIEPINTVIYLGGCLTAMFTVFIDFAMLGRFGKEKTWFFGGNINE